MVEAIPMRLVLNPQTRLFLSSTGGVGELRTPGARAGVEVSEPILARFLEYCMEARSSREMIDFLRGISESGSDAEDAEEVLSVLWSQGILAEPGAVSWNQWDHYHWGEAGYFHFSARSETFADEQGDSPAAAKRETLSGYLGDGPPEFFARLAVEYRALPEPPSKTLNFAQLATSRFTVRNFGGMPASEACIGELLGNGTRWARRLRLESEQAYQAAPEALLASWGTAFELYVVIHRVEDWSPGVYHYDMRNHALGAVAEGQFEEQVFRTIWGQPMALGTAVSTFVVADFERYMWRYRYERAYRNLMINLGEVAQVLIVSGLAAGLTSCMTPAMRDGEIDELLQLNPSEQQALYYLGFGTPPKTDAQRATEKG